MGIMMRKKNGQKKECGFFLLLEEGEERIEETEKPGFIRIRSQSGAEIETMKKKGVGNIL
jgi:hypothetical protein